MSDEAVLDTRARPCARSYAGARPAGPPLLVERVTLCWLQVHQAEGLYAQRLGSLDVEWTDCYQRRIDRAQRRYLQAIRTLAQVRRLAAPAAVQINVAEQQVNTMHGGVRTVA